MFLRPFLLKYIYVYFFKIILTQKDKAGEYDSCQKNNDSCRKKILRKNPDKLII